jgi:isopenicillin-N epimerase
MEAQNLRAQFDLDPTLIYLNAGTHSLCPRRVIDTWVRHTREYELNPTQRLVETYTAMWEVQKRLGAFLNAQPEDLLLRPNVTSAMNALILGVELGSNAAGGEILVSDSEYGATANICRLRAERDGLKLRSFHLPGKAAELAGASEESLAELVLRELKPETKLVMLSHVITGSGLRLPIEKIARETRKRGILLAIDGAHATGALDLDFSRLTDVDLYAGNLHKWVMGPKGTGYGWVHPSIQPRMRPIEAGWMTFEVNPHHAKFAPGHAFAQRFYNSACYDFSPFLALTETFAVWRDWGPDVIRARLAELWAFTYREMKTKTGWECLTPEDARLRGPLLSYELPEKLKAEGYELMHRTFREHRIQIVSSYFQNRWMMRISPHVHNSEEEIARAVGILAGL